MFIYGCYLDQKYHETIENGTKSSHVVISQKCSYSRRSSSTITINVKDKVYSVKLSSGVCEHFPVRSVIGVFYLDKYDEYIYQVKEYHDKSNFMLLVLLISLLPWASLGNHYIFARQNKKTSDQYSN